jgi:hypothetical protein
MGHPWKKPRAKPGMTEREYWRELYPFFEDGTVTRLIKIGKERRRISRMKQDYRELLTKNRLLKRKISEFYEQGEGHGKSSNKR